MEGSQAPEGQGQQINTQLQDLQVWASLARKPKRVPTDRPGRSINKQIETANIVQGPLPIDNVMIPELKQLAKEAAEQHWRSHWTQTALQRQSLLFRLQREEARRHNAIAIQATRQRHLQRITELQSPIQVADIRPEPQQQQPSEVVQATELQPIYEQPELQQQQQVEVTQAIEQQPIQEQPVSTIQDVVQNDPEPMPFVPTRESADLQKRMKEQMQEEGRKQSSQARHASLAAHRTSWTTEFMERMERERQDKQRRDAIEESPRHEAIRQDPIPEQKQQIEPPIDIQPVQQPEKEIQQLEPEPQQAISTVQRTPPRKKEPHVMKDDPYKKYYPKQQKTRTRHQNPPESPREIERGQRTAAQSVAVQQQVIVPDFQPPAGYKVVFIPGADVPPAYGAEFYQQFEPGHPILCHPHQAPTPNLRRRMLYQIHPLPQGIYEGPHAIFSSPTAAERFLHFLNASGDQPFVALFTFHLELAALTPEKLINDYLYQLNPLLSGTSTEGFMGIPNITPIQIATDSAVGRFMALFNPDFRDYLYQQIRGYISPEGPYATVINTHDPIAGQTVHQLINQVTGNQDILLWHDDNEIIPLFAQLNNLQATEYRRFCGANIAFEIMAFVFVRVCSNICALPVAQCLLEGLKEPAARIERFYAKSAIVNQIQLNPGGAVITRGYAVSPRLFVLNVMLQARKLQRALFASPLLINQFYSDELAENALRSLHTSVALSSTMFGDQELSQKATAFRDFMNSRLPEGAAVLASSHITARINQGTGLIVRNWSFVDEDPIFIIGSDVHKTKAMPLQVVNIPHDAHVNFHEHHYHTREIIQQFDIHSRIFDDVTFFTMVCVVLRSQIDAFRRNETGLHGYTLLKILMEYVSRHPDNEGNLIIDRNRVVTISVMVPFLIHEGRFEMHAAARMSKNLEEALTVQISELLVRYGVDNETIYLGTAQVVELNAYTFTSGFPINFHPFSVPEDQATDMFHRLTSIITQPGQIYTAGQMFEGGLPGQVRYGAESQYVPQQQPPLRNVFRYSNKDLVKIVERLHVLNYNSRFAQSASCRSVMEATHAQAIEPFGSCLMNVFVATFGFEKASPAQIAQVFQMDRDEYNTFEMDLQCGKLVSLIVWVCRKRHIIDPLLQIEIAFVSLGKTLRLCGDSKSTYGSVLWVAFQDHIWIGDKDAWLTYYNSKRSRPKPNPFRLVTPLRRIMAYGKNRPDHADSTYIYFDIETFTEKPNDCYALGFQIVSYNQENEIMTDSDVQFIMGPSATQEFVEMLYRIAKDHPKQRFSVVGFNSYKFDYIYLLPHILHRWGTDVVLTGTPTNIKFLQSGNIAWEDLRALMGNCGSLREIAKVFSPQSVQKGSLDFRGIRDWEAVLSRETEIKKYLYNDVALLPIVHKKFIESLNRALPAQVMPFCLPELTTSLSQFVLRHFARFFLRSEWLDMAISVKHASRAEIRKSYHGGRVSCDNVFPFVFKRSVHLNAVTQYLSIWKRGKLSVVHDTEAPLVYLDINSSYPAVMTGNLPLGQSSYSAIQGTELWEFVDDVLYSVSEFHFNEKTQTTLPVVSKNGTLLYPAHWSGVENGNILRFWGIELREAAQLQGFTCKLQGQLEWATRGPLFRDFIETIYSERLKAKKDKNAPLAQALKIVMNALSGKLGQRTFPFTALIHANDLAVTGRDLDSIGEVIFGSCQERHNVIDLDSLSPEITQLTFTRTEEEDELNPGAFVHLISYITAAARARLQMYRRIAGHGQVIYSDTDSLVTTQLGYEHLKEFVDDTKLGMLKVEHQLDFFHALSPKFYILVDTTGKVETKTKGVDTHGLSEPDIIQLFIDAWGGENQIKQTRFRRRPGFVDIEDFYKTISIRRKLNKIHSDGWVQPPDDINDFEKDGVAFSELTVME